MASDDSRNIGMERKQKRSESSNSSATIPQHNPSGPASTQHISRGHTSQRGNAFRGQLRGRGRGWDAASAYSGNSYSSNNRGGGLQDGGRDTEATLMGGWGAAPEAGTGPAGRPRVILRG